MPNLFTPYQLKDVTLRNRIVVSPMCQYVADDGLINDWHRSHLAGLARGGAGLVIAEATAVSPEGRITPGCTGIWSDAQADAWKDAVRLIKDGGAVPGIQIAHAGRKASANRPWEGDDHMADDDPRGWDTIAPSAVPHGANLPKVPRAMTIADIKRVQADFVAAAPETTLRHPAFPRSLQRPCPRGPVRTRASTRRSGATTASSLRRAAKQRRER